MSSSLDFMMNFLESDTDFLKFENVALEVMHLCGYNEIKPFGGFKDKGIDATLVKFFDGKLKERTIFQFSMEICTQNKVEKTLKKLEENNIEYTHFVYVTSKRVSSTEKIKIEDEAKKYKVSAECFDQKTLCFHLSKNNSALWLKYYPDPIKMLLEKKPEENFLNTNEQHKKEILKASILLFEQNKNQDTNNSFIKNFIISFCASNATSPVSLETISDSLGDKFKIKVDSELLQEIVLDLVKEKILAKSNYDFVIAKDVAERYIFVSSSIENKINGIGYKIISKIDAIGSEILSDADRGKIINITREYLLEILKRYSIDIVSSVYNDSDAPPSYNHADIEKLDSILQLDPKVRKIFILATSDVLSSGDADIVEVIYILAMSYTSMYALGINPYLHEFYNSKLNGKIFILDTDFILDSLVKECPEYKSNFAILKMLNDAGASIIIPDECLVECARHARISIRTYDYFGESLPFVSEELSDETILNVFVKGYYYKQKDRKNLTFEMYLKNYYEKDNSIGFLSRIIEESIPFATIQSIDEVATIDPNSEEYTSTFALLHEQAQRSKKAQYRSEQEINEIAQLDTKIFLAAMSKNVSVEKKSPYKLNSYVVTKYYAFNISARLRGAQDNISTTKEALTAYFNLFGNEPVNKFELSQFIFNPITHYVSSEMKDDIKKLAKLGFDISDYSMTRLGYDIDKALHNLLQGFTDDKNIKIYVQSDEYAQLIKFAKLRGYKLSPVISALNEAKNETITTLTAERDAALKEKEKAELKLRRKERHIRRTTKKR